MDNHATRPEVVQALQQGGGLSQRHSVTLERDLLYVAVPMARGGVPVGVARVALPVFQIQENLNRVALIVGGALLVAALLGTVLAFLVARATTGPIEALTRSARQLAAGDLQQNLRVEGRDEVSALAHTFNDMATRLSAQVAALEDGRARLEAILDHMADGLLVVDTEETVQLVNPAALRLLEATPAVGVGRSLTAVLRDHELVAAVREAIATPGDEAGPRLVELGPSGRQHTVQVVATHIGGSTAGGQGTLVLLQDVTELRRTEQVRREFVANVSHELRTPVAALKALVETLEDGALEDPIAARDFLGRMHVEVDGLAQLIEELLELSRIESGRLPLRPQPLDIAPVVASAAERLRPQAERGGVRLVLDLPGDLPHVEADSERIQQVVVNLVHNAVKFTPPGGQVTVSAHEGDGEVSVVVADTGTGISEEALPRLFERFYKVDRARSSGGTGLGLAIAKHLVQGHGGRIWAESAGEGRGATFSFTVPVALDALQT
jgi:two-component system phosphate regulon sensor histidine kinase PhoR